MSRNLLPILAQRIFNTPMLMRAGELSAIAVALQDRFFIDASTVQMLANTGQYKSDRPYHVTQEGWAVVPVIGGLAHRAGQIDADCMTIRSYELIRRDFDAALNDEDVSLIIFEFDSGGGEASGCFDLARHILSMRGKKPILGFINESCFSAAYALACCCDQLFLTSTASAGSIGVICGRLDQTEYNKKLGLNIELFVSGDFKSDFSPHKQLKNDERERLNLLIEKLSREFFELVAEARSISVNQVKSFNAGIFHGQDAVDRGLVDRVMSQDEFFDYLIGGDWESSMFFGKNKESEVSASYTQAQLDAAVSEAKSVITEKFSADLEKAKQEAVAEFSADFEKKKQLAVGEAVSEYKTDTETRLTGIFQSCKAMGRADLAGELMLSDLSLDAAKEKLFSILSVGAESSNLQNHITNPLASSSERNYLLEMCQADQ
ncbi:S49 family peptidase [Zooshikella sp. RANM57]|uniref:S49 family peptidase n=1 Tax=Zooshikella sp. RANM57 TaxID=3425863 RepID=UPI003D6FF89E